MVRFIVVLISFLLVGIFLSSNVSAQLDLSYEIQNIFNSLEGIFRPLFEILFNSQGFDEHLFVKVLFMMVLFFLIKSGLMNFPAFKKQSSGVVSMVSALISIISVRYLSDLQVIQAILIPYSTLGIALTTIFPFLLYFFFVHKNVTSGVGRKLAWIFYLIVLLGVWAYRAPEMNVLSNYIYSGVFIVAIVVFFADKKVREYFAIAEVKKTKKNIDAERIAQVIDKYRNFSRIADETGDSYARRAAERYADLLKKWGVRTF